MSYLIEFLVILVLLFTAALCALVVYVLHTRRTVRTWQSPGNVRILPGRPEQPRETAGTCCLEVPCSARCGQVQQSRHTADYLSGVKDAVEHPNRVRELIRAGQELGDQDDRSGRW